MSSLSNEALIKGADEIYERIAEIVARSLAATKPGDK
jgi:hypothetical protein